MLGAAGPGVALLGAAGPGAAWQGEARHGKARQGKDFTLIKKRGSLWRKLKLGQNKERGM